MTEMKESASTFFFPLRTNVQYFDTPEGFLTFEGRVKQAVILYERVVFEAGLYMATMGPEGAIGMHLPSTQLPPREDLDRFNRTRSQSESFAFSVQTDPAKPFQPLFSSLVERQFLSWFHPLFDELTSGYSVGGLTIADVHLSEVGQQQALLLASEYLETEDALLPKGSPRVQKHIVEDFFKDIVLVSSLGCAGSMDPLHAPMLDYVARRTTGLRAAPGFAALEFQVPHVAALPWEQIAEVRTHPAIVEYRQRLTAVEKTVRDMLPEASRSEIRQEVGNILHQELIKEVRARMALNGRKLAVSVTAQVVGGLIPPIGVIQTAVSVGKEVADFRQERKSWLAVLMKLSRID